jgi:hypothetical protein
LNELTVKQLGTCQVRSQTAQPCSRLATVQLGGIPFCDRCAREQQTYFAIGEVIEEEKNASKSLPAVMDLMRQIRLR